MTEPTKAPRTSVRCWPDDCRMYHETWLHLEGEDPCMCPCHVKVTPEQRARAIRHIQVLVARRQRVVL